MESRLFVRALALPPPPHAQQQQQQQQCLASASRSTADGTFAVADAGVIRVYAASCAALLHEFAAIHTHVHALHYTSFSDALVTLESAGGETFLCVYHDWRERRRVRGYTLPLGALESAAAPANCVAVCSFTGRVAVAMGSVLNVWQCGRGFFEHVLELKVDMAQRHAFLQLEFVAIHGAYLAYASTTEVRVMEIHVRSAKDGDADVDSGGSSRGGGGAAVLALHPTHQQELGVAPRQEPEDEVDCVHVASLDDVSRFVDVPIPCASYGDASAGGDQRDEKRILFDDLEPLQPMVLGRNVAQQEAWNLAGLVKSQDIRVNQALSYFVGEGDVQVLLQRFLPPNHSVRALAFLPETIDNQVSVEARSYTRLLVSTEKNAFLYYFLSQEADLTRKKMSKKVFGGERHALHRTKSRGVYKPIKVGSGRALGRNPSTLDESDGFDDGAASPADDDEAESGRVVMFYQFSSPVSCIAANSSFLFVATLSGLQVWSIWSPCHYAAASRALSMSLVPQPSQPQLLCTQPLPFATAQIAALDSYVVLLPQLAAGGTRESEILSQQQAPYDFIRLGSLAAADRLPEDEFELRQHGRTYPDQLRRSVLIFQQSPPSLIFSYMRNAILSDDVEKIKPSQIDLLLSLFSLYRYRADVGLDSLHLSHIASNTTSSVDDEKERLALELETKLYDTIAKACAADLAAIFTSAAHRNLSRAALLYVASNVPSSEVMERFQAVVGTENRAEVIDATSKYLEAFVFPSSGSLPSIGPSQVQGAATTGFAPPGSSPRTQRGTDNDRDFTRTVLLHYGKYAPEQLSRLIIDSTLAWSLEDIAFGLEKLTESTSQSVLVRIATLVLILRASSFSASDWEVYKKRSAATADREAVVTDREDGKSNVNDFLSMCSFESMTSHVKHLLDDHLDALVRLSVAHPELLVRVTSGEDGLQRFTTSAFALALRENAPLVLLQILERVFMSAVRRQEAVLSSLLFCLSVIGDAAQSSIQRMTHYDTIKQSAEDDGKAVVPSTSASASALFVADQCFVLRLLVFVLEMFPSLEELVEKEELHEDEDELRRVKAAIGLEMMTLCVQLNSLIHSEDLLTSPVTETLLKLFDGQQAQHENSDAHLPEWVHEYLETRCLPSMDRGSAELRTLLRFLFTLSIKLQQEADVVSPVEILLAYEVKSGAVKKRAKKAAVVASQAPVWRLDNDFAALIVLLALPRVSRTVDGLQLIAKRSDFVSLFLPYAKCYCVTLEEWSCLIKTLSGISEDSPEDESARDEGAILENVLNHICSTLGPEELLQVLPDDGDLALYMATIEASVRLGDDGRARKCEHLRLAP